LPLLSHFITTSASSTNSGGKYCATKERHSSTLRFPPWTVSGTGGLVVVGLGFLVVVGLGFLVVVV